MVTANVRMRAGTCLCEGTREEEVRNNRAGAAAEPRKGGSTVAEEPGGAHSAEGDRPVSAAKAGWG